VAQGLGAPKRGFTVWSNRTEFDQHGRTSLRALEENWLRQVELGRVFVKADVASVTEALRHRQNMPDDFRVSITTLPEECYPI